MDQHCACLLYSLCVFLYLYVPRVHLTAVSHNTNGGNLVWFGNQNEVIGDSRVNGLSRCFSLFLFLHLNKGQLTWNVRRTDNRRVCYSPISLLCVV